MEPALNIVNYRYITEDLRAKAKQKFLSNDDIQKINKINIQIQKEQFEQGLTFVSKTTLMDTAYGQGQEIVVFRTVLSNPNTTTTDLHIVLEDQLKIANQIEAKSIRSTDTEVSILQKETIHLQLADASKADLGEALEEYLKKNTIPIGKPISNTKIYILDKYGNLLPPGVTGELYVGGDGLAQGYLNLPELTQEKFILNPFTNDNGKSKKAQEKLYRTGDLARWLPDGNIEFVGRIDHQVKIRGFRIELGEIEAVLSTHPQIQQTVVIAREDIPGDKRLVAYVASDKSLTTNQLREFLKQKLPEYMVPSAFVILDTLPLTSNGKVDRKALPAPDGQISREHEYVAPRTPNEEIIANIFASVLGVQDVGIHDNFFALGGHSLLATQLISRLRVAFSLDIPLRAVFESPTVAQFEQTLTQLHTTNSRLSLPPIQPRTDSEQLPLSWAQERLWFLNQLEESSAAYNISGAVRIAGNLNVNALQQALSEIVRRHEILHTSFPTVNGTPTQVIDPEATINIKVVDLRQLEVTERETSLKQQAQLEAITPFDLEIAPLIRCSLLHLDATEYLLLLTMHHIVSDGWSMGVFIQEVSRLYQANGAGQPSPLAELPIQYADFAVWQRQWLSGEVLQNQLNYWQQQLAGAPELLQLPTDYPRPSVQTYQGAIQSFNLNTNLTQKLQTLSRESGTTLFMTLLAGFATLLYRYTGQEDIVIGSPIANRNRSEIESLIGFFVNTLVLRTSFEENPSIKDLLAQVRESTLKAYEHQDVPFEQVVEALQPQRSLSHSPLFQVMFILQNAPMGEVELPGVTLTQLAPESTIAKFDLTLSISETSQGLVGEWEYNTDLFEGSTIERMAAHFQNLLSAIVENPQLSVAELPLLSEAQRHQLLVEWNQTQADYPKDICIHQLFEAQVEKTPDAVAVVFEEQQLTYRELNQRANQLAHYLKKLGVKPEVLVGICVERSLEMVVGLLGIFKAGGAYVPIDPTYPQERLALILSDSQTSLLLTQQHLQENLPPHTAHVLCLDTDWETISSENLPNTATSENLAYLIYTSGSTGKPKGVQIPHRAVVNFLQSMGREPGLRASDTLFAVTSISFDIAALELYLPLITGARLELASREVATDPKQLTEQLKASGATVMQATPATWRMLLAANWQGHPNLKILCGGEALPQDLAEELLNKGATLWNLYGPTETTIWSTAYRVEATQLSGAIVPIGRPIANTKIYLLDSGGQPVPVGIPGELHIGGAGLARGYLNRPELTAEKFITNAAGERLYKSGDLARYLRDGNIEYIERLDHQVKIRGFRIELGEIEAVLSQHPAVEQAVVIAREDEPGNKHLVAYVVSDESLTINQLREFLKHKLPEYMVPSAFVTLDALPLTPNGKVDRKALPAPDGDFSQEHEYVAPRTPSEGIIANIFASVLGVQNVGIHDNFFELGGHSLLATQVISRIEKSFEVELPLRLLFESPTVVGLAEAIHKARKTDLKWKTPPIERVSRNGKLPLSFAQARLWFLDQLDSDSLAYNLPAAVSLVGSLNVAALEQTFNEIVRRHEVLRTTFTMVEGQPIQLITPSLNISLPVVNLCELPEAEQKNQVQQLVNEWGQRLFNLAQDPLLRFMLVQLNEQEHLLLFSTHHIISDGWSIGVFIREMATLYEAFSQGQPSPLPELPIQYVDFAVWQRQWLQGEVLETQLAYWKQQLGANPPV
ncbi:MAG: amino acid adenylation domain-containing protein, partial [Moorea sp. SIO2I5]|nr:amino acid adenylation domain-containing protein [Moorena sp. SIO2I5]